MKTLTAFNVATQQDELATASVDKNNEFVFTFEDGSFIKMPSSFGKDDIMDFLAKHKQDNQGQVSADQMERQKSANEAVLDEL